MPLVPVADPGLRLLRSDDAVTGATYLMYDVGVVSISEAETRERDRDRARASDAGVKPVDAPPFPVRSVSGRPKDDVTDVAVGTRLPTL